MKKLAVIGDPIEHSLSPEMHNSALKELNLENTFSYEKKRVRAEDLEKFIQKIRKNKFFGANITIPHKQNVIKYLDELTEEAKLSQSVNTVYSNLGKVIGHSTDGEGCVEAFKEKSVELEGKKIVIIGAGGACRSILFSILKRHPKKILIINRTLEKAKCLANEAKKVFKKNIIVERLENKKSLSDYDILINTTSVGMKNDKSPINQESLHKNLVVMDIIYNPIETRLLREAKEIGCMIIYGTTMLVHQGALSFQIWTGKKAPINVMKKCLISRLKSNIALIGFMGTGKSTIGKKISARTGKKFVETDEMIEEKTGKKIDKIFKEEGEKKFREIESETIKKVSENYNQVISCGGGAVLRKENVEALRQSSFIVLFESPDSVILERILKSRTRPLMNVDDKMNAIKKLKKKRERHYNSSADIKIMNSKISVEEASKIIIEKIDKFQEKL